MGHNGEKDDQSLSAQKKASYGLVNFERRKYPRFSIDLPIEYYRLPSAEKRPARVSNISEGGLMIYVPEKLTIGQQLRVKIFFLAEPNLAAMEAIGEVVWIDLCLEEGNEYRSGLKFIEVSPDDLKRLKNFLHNLAKI